MTWWTINCQTWEIPKHDPAVQCSSKNTAPNSYFWKPIVDSNYKTLNTAGAERYIRVKPVQSKGHDQQNRMPLTIQGLFLSSDINARVLSAHQIWLETYYLHHLRKGPAMVNETISLAPERLPKKCLDLQMSRDPSMKNTDFNWYVLQNKILAEAVLRTGRNNGRNQHR